MFQLRSVVLLVALMALDARAIVSPFEDLRDILSPPVVDPIGNTALPPCAEFMQAMLVTGESCHMEVPALCPRDDEDCIQEFRRQKHHRPRGGDDDDDASASGSGSGSGESGSGSGDWGSAGSGWEVPTESPQIQCLDEFRNPRSVVCRRLESTGPGAKVTSAKVPTTGTPTSTTRPTLPNAKPTTGVIPDTKESVMTKTAVTEGTEVSETTENDNDKFVTTADNVHTDDVTTDQAAATSERDLETPKVTVMRETNVNNEEHDAETDGNEQMVTIVGIGVGAFVGCVILAVIATILVLRFKQNQETHYMVDAEINSQRSGSSGSNSSATSTTPLQKKSPKTQVFV
eukprot:scpid80855/ scgid24334/ 